MLKFIANVRPWQLLQVSAEHQVAGGVEVQSWEMMGNGNVPCIHFHVHYLRKLTYNLIGVNCIFVFYRLTSSFNTNSLDAFIAHLLHHVHPSFVICSIFIFINQHCVPPI